MTDIFPAEDGSVSDVINTLRRLGFTDGRDYWLHYTWDFKPFVQTTPDTYDAWTNEVSSAASDSEPDGDPDDGGDGEKADESDGENTSDQAEKSTSATDNSATGNNSGNGRKTGKRR